MITIATEEAETHLRELLQRSSKGECFIVVDHGEPLACLGPLPTQARRGIMKDIALRARNLRSRIQRDVTSIKEDIARGRL
jgi:antitoxin (DNA-binding transcriptional repressor) of toxin-antitoxin stability system